MKCIVYAANVRRSDGTILFRLDFAAIAGDEGGMLQLEAKLRHAKLKAGSSLQII
jgi:hypothetical protein